MCRRHIIIIFVGANHSTQTNREQKQKMHFFSLNIFRIYSFSIERNKDVALQME